MGCPGMGDLPGHVTAKKRLSHLHETGHYFRAS